MTPGGVTRTCWGQEGSGSRRRITTKSLFSLFGGSPVCLQDQRLSDRTFQFLLARIFFCCCFWKGVCQCRRFNPSRGIPFGKVLPLCRMYAEGSVSPYRVVVLRRPNKALFLSTPSSPLHFLSICLFCLPCLCLSAFSSHTQMKRLQGLHSLPEGAKLLEDLLPAAHKLLSQHLLLVCQLFGQMYDKWTHTQKECYANEHPVTVCWFTTLGFFAWKLLFVSPSLALNTLCLFFFVC